MGKEKINLLASIKYNMNNKFNLRNGLYYIIFILFYMYNLLSLVYKRVNFIVKSIITI